VLTGRALGREARDRFSRYLDLLLLWNRSQNLTGLGSPSEIVRGLFEDSLLFLPLLPGRPVRVVDLGAGAGIPGIPIRIVDEDVELTLVESRRKRVSFLKTVRRQLGLERGLAIEEGRAEVLVSDVVLRGGEFDVAIARAIGNPRDVVPTAMRYVKAGGIFIVSGPPPDRLAGLDVESQGQWRIQRYPELGVTRGFFVAQRAA